MTLFRRLLVRSRIPEKIPGFRLLGMSLQPLHQSLRGLPHLRRAPRARERRLSAADAASQVRDRRHRWRQVGGSDELRATDRWGTDLCHPQVRGERHLLLGERATAMQVFAGLPRRWQELHQGDRNIRPVLIEKFSNLRVCQDPNKFWRPLVNDTEAVLHSSF